jgi:hypothetical protein
MKQEELRQQLKRSHSIADNYQINLKRTKRDLKMAKEKLNRLKKERMATKPTSVQEGIHRALDDLILSHYPKFKLANSMNSISLGIWTWRDGVCQDTFIERVKKHLSTHVFSPLKICRAMDLFGGMLNFQSLRVLRWIESERQVTRNLLFPSLTTVSHFIANFTGFCSQYVHINFFTNKFGEGFEFDHRQIISLIWKQTGKDSVAEQKCMKVVLTADGSKLTNNINVVLMGLKETEAYQSMPLIGSHLLKVSNNEDTDNDSFLSVQSAFLS